MKWITVVLLSMAFSLHSEDQKLIVMLPGEADHNVERVYNSNPEHPGYKESNLTKAGILAVQKTAKELKAQGFSSSTITAVYVSPLPRAQQTADILVKEGVVSQEKIITDKRLSELDAGDLEGKPTFILWRPSFAKEYHAESEQEVKKRAKEFYDFLLDAYSTGNILVVTHELVAKDLVDLASRQLMRLKPGDAKVIPLRYTP